MQVEYTPHFKRRFAKFSPTIQRKFRKQLGFLFNDINHPSLRAKKFDEAEGVWQARVDNNVRFYFRITRELYSLLDIRRHKD